MQNHFEAPPLFYVAVILGFITQSGRDFAVFCAWLFVAASIVHTLIHVGSNSVRYRFFTFLISLLFLAALWISVFEGIIQHAG